MWEEKGGDDYPVVPVGAHGGRRESSGKQSRPSKSYDDVITWASNGKIRDLLFAEVSPCVHPYDPSLEEIPDGIPLTTIRKTAQGLKILKIFQ